MTTSRFLDAVLAHGRQRPSAPALWWRGESLSYRSLLVLAEAVRGYLADRHLPKDRPVGLVARKSPSAIASVLGCLAAGHRFVLPSTDLGQDGLSTLFANTQCSGVFRAPDTESLLGEALPSASVDTSEPILELETVLDPTPFLLTTSGSTGLPKVVPLPITAVDAFTEWAAATFGIGPQTRVLNYAPLNFDLCFFDIWATLAAGGEVVLVEQDRAAQGPYLLDLLTQRPPHIIQAVPLFYRLLADAAEATGATFSETHHAIFTGDAMPPALLARLPALFPTAAFANIYGCTETNDSTLYEVPRSRMTDPAPLPIGTPLPGVATLIVDDENRAIEGAGSGELLVWTPFQTPGYLDPALNAEKFTPRKDASAFGLSPDTPFFRSGDIVRRHADGTLSLEGRKDFHVKVRGVRVNTREIERILTDHLAVVEAAIVPVPDPIAGVRLHAAVQRRPGSAVNSLVLRALCAQKLVRAAIPSTFDIGEAPLPKTSTGKIDRKQILATHVPHPVSA